MLQKAEAAAEAIGSYRTSSRTNYEQTKIRNKKVTARYFYFSIYLTILFIKFEIFLNRFLVLF